jgi:hypothetical protein
MPKKDSRAGAAKMENKNKYSERREQLRKISNEVEYSCPNCTTYS